MPHSPADQASAGPPSVIAGRVGYVLKRYPRFSETFIVREILAREAGGEDIRIASLRPPGDPRFHPMIGTVRAPVTWMAAEPQALMLTWDYLRRLAALGVVPDPEAMALLTGEEPGVAAQALQVAAWALENQVSHLHAHFVTAAGRTTRLAAALTGLPWTVTAHAKDIFHTGYDPARREQVMRSADAVIAVSDSTAGYLRGAYPGARITRIYNGVEAAVLAARPAPARVTGAMPLIAAVGRLVAKKGWPVLLEAVALLRDEGTPVRVTLIGSGPLEAPLRARRDELGLAGLVAMPGALPQHDVLDLIASADAFAAPCIIAPDGDRDGLPTVLLEAMALGTPVVSTPVSGVVEAVCDESTGLLAEPGDPASLARALHRVTTDDALARRLAAGARALVRERFDVPVQAGYLRELTRSVAQGRSAGEQGAA